MNISVLASTNGTDLQAIIDRIKDDSLSNVDLKCVISNKKDCYALERAQSQGYKTYFVDPKDKEREAFDKEVAEILDKEEVELIVMVGYMRLVSEWFINKYQFKIINIHPSLLPDFPGIDTNVHQAVLDADRKESGCTISFVDKGVDSGPIILQKKCSVDENETVKSLKDKVQALEKEWYPKVIQWIADGKVEMEGEEVTIIE